MKQVISGLDNLRISKEQQRKIKGNVGYLCNSASVDSNLNHGIKILKGIYGDQLTKVFTPQHGLFADVQDNMIESPHFEHPHFGVKIYSLYSETRSPKKEWISDLDHLIIDLQDVGTRVYTYIYTTALAMKACGESEVKVTVLDRPNPIGDQVEGNVLENEFSSFVGMYEIPMRHGLTIGEFATMANQYFGIDCELEVIPLQNWSRSMFFDETRLPWVLPSPNLPGLESALVYPGNVLFEGTKISEGRGTVRPFELIGHPKIDAFQFKEHIDSLFSKLNLSGFFLRPLVYKPTFHKYSGQVCGGFQIHVTDRRAFNSWQFTQIFMRELYRYLGSDFEWLSPPYEYEYDKMPIDILNGTDKIRKWVENNGSFENLLKLEKDNLDSYLDKKESILLYK